MNINLNNYQMYKFYLLIVLLIALNSNELSAQYIFQQSVFEAQIHANDKIKIDRISNCQMLDERVFLSYAEIKYLHSQRVKLKKYLKKMIHKDCVIFVMEGIYPTDNTAFVGQIWDNNKLSVYYHSMWSKDHKLKLKIISTDVNFNFENDWVNMHKIVNSWNIKDIYELAKKSSFTDPLKMIVSKVTIKDRKIKDIQTIVFTEFPAEIVPF